MTKNSARGSTQSVHGTGRRRRSAERHSKRKTAKGEGRRVVFLTWGGEQSLQIARALKDTILAHDSLSVRLAPAREGEKNWPRLISDGLKKSDIVIACLSYGTSFRPWVNYECGFADGKGKLLPLAFRATPTAALGFTDYLDGAVQRTYEVLLRRLERKGGPIDGFQEHLASTFPLFEKKLEECVNSEYTDRESIDRQAEALFKALLKLIRPKSQGAGQNVCVKRLLIELIRHQVEEIEGVLRSEKRFEVDASDYHVLLCEMQKRIPGISVTAIASPGRHEHYWDRRAGNEVLESTPNSKSHRIFIFDDVGHLDRYKTMLLQHSRRYAVSVASARHLELQGLDAKDFSIISGGGSQISAKLVEARETGDPRIVFSSDESDIRACEQRFRDIKNASVDFGSVNTDSGASRFFHSTPPRSEMSEYIPDPEYYHRHERFHVHYESMLNKIAELVRGLNPEAVLESGGGTGYSAERIFSGMDNVRIDISELDSAYYRFMKVYLIRHANIACHNNETATVLADSRNEYDAIVSSFAEHHIKPHDVAAHLQRIKSALKRGGKFICGDEFFAPYRPHDWNDYLLKMRAWHNYVIDVAEAEGHPDTASLERLALDSGERKIGDFKVSHAVFEGYLREASLAFNRHDIGPDMERGIGGISVYECWK